MDGTARMTLRADCKDHYWLPCHTK
jgi:hypothetical protein